MRSGDYEKAFARITRDLLLIEGNKLQQCQPRIQLVNRVQKAFTNG